VDRRAGDDGAEIVEQSGRYALIRDADGVAIYDLDLGSDADPVASYPQGDEGFEAAWGRYGRLVRGARRERFGLIRVLGIVVVVGVIVWVVAGVGYGTLFVGFDLIGNGPQSRWWPWIQAADTIAWHVWVGALAVLLVLWIWQRFGSDAGGATAPRRPDAADRGSGPDAP
jgi:hypothetical protein